MRGEGEERRRTAHRCCRSSCFDTRRSSLRSRAAAYLHSITTDSIVCCLRSREDAVTTLPHQACRSAHHAQLRNASSCRRKRHPSSTCPRTAAHRATPRQEESTRSIVPSSNAIRVRRISWTTKHTHTRSLLEILDVPSKERRFDKTGSGQTRGKL